MNRSLARWLPAAGFLLLYALHNDLWLWDNPSRVLGLPVGLTYHVALSLAVSVLMLVVVKYAWPMELDPPSD